MKPIVIIRRKTLVMYLMIGFGLLVGVALIMNYVNREDVPVMAGQQVKEFYVITTEFKSKLDDGRELEVYRWDPGTLVVEKGDQVRLRFFGVNGESHPFEIQGLGVKGVVEKGKETVVTFRATKEGTYPIVCYTHPDYQHNGPMIAYLVVD